MKTAPSEKRVLRDRRTIKPPNYFDGRRRKRITDPNESVVKNSTKKRSIEETTVIVKDIENSYDDNDDDDEIEEVNKILNSEKPSENINEYQLIQSILQNAKNCSPVVLLSKFDKQVGLEESRNDSKNKRSKKTINVISIRGNDHDYNGDANSKQLKLSENVVDKTADKDNCYMQINQYEKSRDVNDNVNDSPNMMIVSAETKFSMPSAMPISIYRRPNLFNRDVFSSNFAMYAKPPNIVRRSPFHHQILNNKYYPSNYSLHIVPPSAQQVPPVLRQPSALTVSSNTVSANQLRLPPKTTTKESTYHSLTAPNCGAVIGSRRYGYNTAGSLHQNRFLWHGDNRRSPPLTCPSCYEVFFDADEFESHYRLMHTSLYLEEYGRYVPCCFPGPFGGGKFDVEQPTTGEMSSCEINDDDSYVPQLDLACKRCFKRNIDCTGTFMLFR